jgi:hypothetical protein
VIDLFRHAGLVSASTAQKLLSSAGEEWCSSEIVSPGHDLGLPGASQSSNTAQGRGYDEIEGIA